MAFTTFVAEITKIKATWLNYVNRATYGVADKAAAVLYTPVAGETMQINSADGRGNTWRAVTGAAVATYSDDGGSYCGTVFIPTSGDGSSAWIRDYNGNKNGKWYGMDASLTSNSTEITALIASFTDKGGLADVDAGVYDFQTNVHLDRPVMFLCEGRFDVSTNPNTSGTLLVTFKWTGAADEHMFTFSRSSKADMLAATTTSEVIFGGGIDGVLLDGNELAAVGIWAASTNYSKFNIQVRNFKLQGMIVDGGNNALSVRNEFTIHMVYGAGTASRPMTGLLLREYNGKPTTQNRLLSINGLIYDGDLVKFDYTDNNVCNHIHGVTHPSGSGYAVRFANGGAEASRLNYIEYINGDIKAESASWGNRIIHHNSESSHISIDAGGQLHYDTQDYVNAEVFKSHSYVMSDDHYITPAMMNVDGTFASHAIASSLWDSILFNHTANGYAVISLPVISKWNDGTVVAISFTFSVDGTSAGNAVFQVRAMTPAHLGGIVTPPINENVTVAVAASLNTENIRKATLSTPVAYTRGDTLLFRIDRLPADAADTNTDGIHLLGLILHYESTGPDGGGGGPFDISLPYK